MTVCDGDWCAVDVKHRLTIQTQLKCCVVLYMGFWPRQRQRCYTASHGILVQKFWLTAAALSSMHTV